MFNMFKTLIKTLVKAQLMKDKDVECIIFVS